MTLSLNMSEADTLRVQDYAARKNLNLGDFLRDTIMDKVEKEEAKDKRNAEYLAKLDRGLKQMKEGTGKYFASVDELREYFYGSKLRG